MWWIATTPLAPVGAAGARHTPRSRGPPCPSTVVVPERNASVILRSLSFCEGFGGEPAVGNAAQDRDGRGEDPALVVRKRFDVD
jgi:hypothetical protein